ncbi:TPA: hypothetical protein I7671_21920, partial [Vibrio vulnificus]|nr:hypothetical protein [Vibrio vulnificus]
LEVIMESGAQQTKRVVRFMNLLPSGEDSTLVVLKGHLLIEELLTDLLVLCLNQDNPLGIKVNNNMMFAKKLELCWIFLRESALPKEIWISLKALNSIRNKMSHHVAPDGVNDSINNFIRGVANYDPFGLVACSDIRKLELSISCLYVLLNEQLYLKRNS